MTLADHFPVIDDRTYADIVDEVRARIPRYTPEWTDLNESDPGMTMIELFAWLTEMQIYRLGQVPKLNYLKFLQLVGIELEPATPAHARITFPLKPAHPQATVIVPALTQVAAAQRDAQGAILFELERALTAIRAPLLAMQSFDGFVFRDLSGIVGAEGEATSFEPFGHTFGTDAAFYIGFGESLPPVSFSLTAFSAAPGRKVPVMRCEDAGTFEPSRLAWEVWDGREWRGLTELKDESWRLTRTGEIHLRGPAEGMSQPQVLGRVAEPLHWLRARVTRAEFQKPPALAGILTNTVLAVQAETLEFENLGGSNGEVEQVFRLADAPILPGSLVLEVNEGRGYEEWTEVRDFSASQPDDAHYVLDRANGEVRFSDGRQGRIPVGNPRAPRNIRARSYRVGGGARGNVAAGQLTALQSAIPGIDEDGLGNRFPGAGGGDEESLQAAMKRAPVTMRSRERAVAAVDFEELAMRAGNIARARALPLHHPDFPGIEVPGTVTVLVIPDVEGPAPVPSQGTLNAVCALLNERRLLTTELYVTGPSYRTVTVSAEIVVEDTTDLAEVKEALLADLALYFDPIIGGENSRGALPADDQAREGTGWPFGGDIYYSLLYRRLLRDGVKRVASLTIMLDDEEFPPCSDVPLAEGLLLVSGAHAIDVRYDDGAEGDG